MQIYTRHEALDSAIDTWIVLAVYCILWPTCWLEVNWGFPLTMFQLFACVSAEMRSKESRGLRRSSESAESNVEVITRRQISPQLVIWKHHYGNIHDCISSTVNYDLCSTVNNALYAILIHKWITVYVYDKGEKKKTSCNQALSQFICQKPFLFFFLYYTQMCVLAHWLKKLSE